MASQFTVNTQTPPRLCERIQRPRALQPRLRPPSSVASLPLYLSGSSFCSLKSSYALVHCLECPAAHSWHLWLLFRSSARPSVKTPWSFLFQSLGCFMAPPHRWSFVLLLLYISSLCIVGTNYSLLAECMVNIIERFLTLFWEKERKILLSVIILCKKCL